MSVEPKDDLDRAIDEALASMVGGEPRRVSAASVRQAMGESRRSSLPPWLAAAAVLIVGLTVALRARVPVAEAPSGLSRSGEARPPREVRPTPSPDHLPAERAIVTASATSMRVRPRTTTDAPYQGLPRLTIASLDLPEPLDTDALDAGPIQIPRIEIAPLAVSSLSPEQERN